MSGGRMIIGKSSGYLSTAVTLLVVAFAAIAVTPTPAQAHGAPTYYTTRWPSDSLSVSYGLNQGFPTGAFRSRVYDGKTRWNNAANTGHEPNIYWLLADDVNYGSALSPCGVPGISTGAIFWNDLDYISPGTLGATRFCNSGGLALNFTIEFDNDQNWYAFDGDAPSNSWDFWSIASHEFGHVMGMTGGSAGGHFPETDPVCPENNVRQTMCPGHSSLRGTEYIRWLEPHDTHTFAAAYP